MLKTICFSICFFFLKKFYFLHLLKYFLWIIVLSLSIHGLTADIYNIHGRKSIKFSAFNSICDLSDVQQFFVTNPSDCRGWIGCYDGNAYVGFCDEGYFFNEQSQNCDYEENIKCKITKNALCDSDNEGYFIEHPSDCRGWLWCSNGNGMEGFCPEGFFFNYRDQTCDFPDNVFCPWIPTTTITVNPLCENVENGAFISHPTNCNKWIWCFNGKASEGSCPDEFYFNGEDQTCDFPENVECPWETSTPTISTTVIDTTPIAPETTTTIIPETSPEIPITTTILPDTTTTEIISTTPVLPETSTTEFPEISTTTILPETSTTTVPETTTTVITEPSTTAIVPDTTTTMVPETTTTMIPDPTTTTTIIPETTTINPDAFNPCEGQPPGTFVPSLTRCSGWFHCAYGVATEGDCRPGLHFDPIRQVCDFPDKVKCTIVELCNGVFDREFIADPTNCQGWYRCEAEQAFHGSCPDGFNFSEEKQFCDYPENVVCSACINVPDGAFVKDPINCQGFYLCRSGISTWGSCTDGFYFNETLQGCDLEENVICPINHKCNGFSEGYLLPHPRNCQKFYRCNREETVIGQCPDGFYFTEKHQACDYPENVECAVNPLCVDVQDNQKIRNPLDCQSWYVCKNGIPSEGACPDNYSFAEYMQDYVPSDTFDCPIDFQCVGIPNGMFIAVENDCQSWYRCDSGRAISGSCPEGFYFTETYQACDYEKNVECLATIIPPTVIPPTTTPATPINPCEGVQGGTLIDNPESCAEYFICYNNVALPSICLNDKVFNPIIGECDDNANVNCFDDDNNLINADRCYKQPDNTFLPHSIDCAKWILCINEKSIEGACPPPYLFNSIAQICDFSYNVVCLNGTA